MELRVIAIARPTGCRDPLSERCNPCPRPDGRQVHPWHLAPRSCQPLGLSLCSASLPVSPNSTTTRSSCTVRMPSVVKSTAPCKSLRTHSANPVKTPRHRWLSNRPDQSPARALGPVVDKQRHRLRVMHIFGLGLSQRQSPTPAYDVVCRDTHNIPRPSLLVFSS
ncbi:hypothetical protein LX36DRAFT_233219 [Colletotrichum falcatum]|nr:hypothetical protein LX36DRAFT_233219 [Colletotrichum falcatum]